LIYPNQPTQGKPGKVKDIEEVKGWSFYNFPHFFDFLSEHAWYRKRTWRL